MAKRWRMYPTPTTSGMKTESYWYCPVCGYRVPHLVYLYIKTDVPCPQCGEPISKFLPKMEEEHKLTKKEIEEIENHPLNNLEWHELEH